jgi:hypothetical protein
MMKKIIGSMSGAALAGLMRSLTLASRLTAIVVVSLLAVWLALVVSFYAGRDWEEENFWPTPGRVAAILSAVEAASPEQRSDILAALNTRTLTVRVEDKMHSHPPADPAKVADEELIRKYAGDLRDRAFTVSQHSVRLDRPNVFRIWSRARQALEVRIGLETGNTLVIESTPPCSLPLSVFRQALERGLSEQALRS